MLSDHYEVIGHDGDEDWLSKRRIGSSDSPVLLGVSTWSSPMRIYAEKIGDLPPWAGSEKTEMGKRMESVIARMVIEDLNAEEGDPRYAEGKDGRLLRSARWPCLTATCDSEVTDGMTGDTFPLEIKNAESHSAWDDGPPPIYWVQCQHQLAVTGGNKILLGVLIRGWKLRWAWIERDTKFIEETLAPECQAFWDCVENRRPPPLDASEHTYRALRAIFGDIQKKEETALPGEFLDLTREFQTLGAQMDLLKERQQAIKNMVREAVGTAYIARLPDGSHWRNQKNGLRLIDKDE